MLSEGRTYLSISTLYVCIVVITVPGLASPSTTLSMNLISDWLRDKLDPMLRA